MARTQTSTESDLFIITPTRWMMEKRTDGWYFAPFAEGYNRYLWNGPYRSLESVTLTIARHIRKELVA